MPAGIPKSIPKGKKFGLNEADTKMLKTTSVNKIKTGGTSIAMAYQRTGIFHLNSRERKLRKPALPSVSKIITIPAIATPIIITGNSNNPSVLGIVLALNSFGAINTKTPDHEIKNASIKKTVTGDLFMICLIRTLKWIEKKNHCECIASAFLF